VKWRGYDETFNSWVNATDIKIIYCIILRNISVRPFRLLLPANTIPDFSTKLSTPLELEHDSWNVGLVEIPYPKGYRKRFWPNTVRLCTEEIIFPVKHYESVFDLLTNIPQFFEQSANKNFIRIFGEYVNKYQTHNKKLFNWKLHNG
jgi:hypothetical protein